MNENIKLVIADDHVHFRDGLALNLNEDSRMVVVGKAADAEELVRVAQYHEPDVIVTDLVMPGEGITAIRRLVALGFQRIVVLTGFEDEDRILEALESGALGYVTKIADKEEIIRAILQVYRFQPYCSDATSSALMKQLAKSSYDPYKKISPLNFSEQELEIIRLTCFDLTIGEIAKKVYLSPRKVSRLKEKIKEDTAVSGRYGLLFYALKTGIIKLSDFP
jgi:DNA-binding NarL/FixJ family response regulator